MLGNVTPLRCSEYDPSAVQGGLALGNAAGINHARVGGVHFGSGILLKLITTSFCSLEVQPAREAPGRVEWAQTCGWASLPGSRLPRPHAPVSVSPSSLGAPQSPGKEGAQAGEGDQEGPRPRRPGDARVSNTREAQELHRPARVRRARRPETPQSRRPPPALPPLPSPSRPDLARKAADGKFPGASAAALHTRQQASLGKPCAQGACPAGGSQAPGAPQAVKIGRVTEPGPVFTLSPTPGPPGRQGGSCVLLNGRHEENNLWDPQQLPPPGRRAAGPPGRAGTQPPRRDRPSPLSRAALPPPPPPPPPAPGICRLERPGCPGPLPAPALGARGFTAGRPCT
ncbi:uncharacterized protein LOC133772433 [Lepus europaeus]|uniref:uncharacterized protein LOC133772433 n=1 Tax=Lepus europaeus TaxID=9983 RepID=UPI002B484166|nr:uncharacterized protein LOC133772433 [Lepus europaeus]